MSRALPLSEIKAKLVRGLDEVVTTQERVTVTRNGRPVAVVLSTDVVHIAIDLNSGWSASRTAR